MKHRTIQFRLTAWYFASVAVVVTLFAAGSWFAMRAYTYRTIDRDLRYQMGRVVPFIQEHSLNSRAAFGNALINASDSSIIGIFLQITDDQHNLLYESDTLTTNKTPFLTAPSGSDTSVTMSTINNPVWPLRIASSHVVVAGTRINVHVVQPLLETLSALRAYALILAVLVPIALLLTTSVGYWMSRRALRPMEQIRMDADSIDPADLTARLPVPPSEDELSRMAQTLNAMLTRIETGFRSIQQFTADASHELRAPLSLITTAADVSLRRERAPEEMKETLHMILREARHMSSLVENLLALARGDARKRVLAEIVDLAAMLRELVAEVRPLADEKGLSLRLVVPDQDIPVRGVAVDLRRLFLILLDNAIKYTETGSIMLTVRCTDGVVEVEVKDTGIGIEPVALPHVFDRFWRADKVRARSEGGTGLGLSLAHQIVQHHEGSILAKSEFGLGSIFTVQLNLAPAEPMMAAESRLARQGEDKLANSLIRADQSHVVPQESH